MSYSSQLPTLTEYQYDTLHKHGLVFTSGVESLERQYATGKLSYEEALILALCRIADSTTELANRTKIGGGE